MDLQNLISLYFTPNFFYESKKFIYVIKLMHVFKNRSICMLRSKSIDSYIILFSSETVNGFLNKTTSCLKSTAASLMISTISRFFANFSRTYFSGV